MPPSATIEHDQGGLDVWTSNGKPLLRGRDGTLPPRLFDIDEDASTTELAGLVKQTLQSADCPLASAIIHNIPIYDCDSLDVSASSSRETLMTEWYNVLLDGPGVLILRGMYERNDLLNRVNDIYTQIIEDEKESKKGDHFSPNATNDRIWNSLSKHCLIDPRSFVKYYSNPWLALISEAYLGPGYRVTAQVNVVHPGGAPQTVHRDYHLGFQSKERVARWPKAMHAASTLLTLQGAVAHTDMSLQSGPTRLLPFSQKLDNGYLASHDQAVRDLFLQRHVSVPLDAGDGLFFSPALFHAAGENVTEDVHRVANLLQISSAFGKPMESIDSLPLVAKTWSLLQERYASEGSSDSVRAYVQAIAEGYPFPTNLDHRVPRAGGMAPESEQELLIRGLEEGWELDRIMSELRQMKDDSEV